MRMTGLMALLAACTSDNKVGVYNTAPSVSITSPADGSDTDEGLPVVFEAKAQDDFDDPADLILLWSSDRDGELPGAIPADGDGYLSYTTSNLSAGNHTITLQATDSEGESSTDNITVVINDVPDAPEIAIIHPATGESAYEGVDFTFVIQVSDGQDSPTALTLSFSSDNEADGEFCTPTADSLGVASCAAQLSGGDHFLTFTATDTSGLSSSSTTFFVVVSIDDQDIDGDGWTTTQGDCDDGDDSAYPGATEYCNGQDDDCDDVIDNDTPCHDNDGDGLSYTDGDCDDTNDAVYPGAAEVYDAVDNDCDSIVDEGTEGYDDDGDGLTEIGGDCDDADAATKPGASEIADGEDNDCDGTTDEGTSNYDDDGDGYSEAGGDCDDTTTAVSPVGTEKCGDGIDNDCDDSADEESASGCTTYYYDYDGDLYGSSSVSGKCLCSSSGYYTSSVATDCYDYNASANPGATSYSSSPRGDSSYDYNCDGTQSQYYTSTYSCDTDWTGFDCDSYTNGYRSVPGCGSSGTWYTGCSASWFDCDYSSSTTLTQICR